MVRIALLGFGEAGQAFTAGWKELPQSPAEGLATYDIKVDNPSEHENLRQACARLDVLCADNPAQAFSGRGAIFSLVTADRALEAAQTAVSAIETGSYYFDCNSCAPSTKAQAAEMLSTHGVRYVDVAVMAPVHPARHRTPLLIAGSHAQEALALLTGLGMNARIAGREPGQASTIKMLRSVMVKGLEALTAECVLAARRAGVEDAVLSSLQASDPGIDWIKRAAYNLERMMVHGARRAAEMQEVARTLRDLDLPDRMTTAAADWQRQIAALSLKDEDEPLGARADRILGELS
ncbi:DUF1932 domain-containing protein [Rhizobium sp. LC145]|jgi:3-hydroxyisobutyrate dehydrogenase-like beta-hydroxyacid dehydrogenase|uniref:NAD(P)-dependent oxidoreductase n=1 Tax=Rhizobium sp. LC145 TaxID=1120688 RepID=UPI00062A2E06|nr:DUF1932 domain-containing protein [Rhizobium sp. LC145]KKX33122.1 3-hydroxyisobutyrate dehydrogenase [Rhizobium sp. LC145]TKT68718.1 NAD(P)-dependent oxidoreductase [Rhizobiaceae bacterium LC148]